MLHSRLGCSTISFRHLALDRALAWIAALGFTEIDLGALPGICDHVPYELTPASVDAVAGTVASSGLAVRSINCDIGDLNRPLNFQTRAARDGHLDMLLTLAVATGSRALVLPCGAVDRHPAESLDADLDRVAGELMRAAERAAPYGVEVWTESQHFYRLCWNLERAQQLTDRLARSDVGVVMDFSHIVAAGQDPVEFVDRFGGRIAHVHIRDAVPGNINLSVGNGHVDFDRGLKVLAGVGYSGHFALELSTLDITDDQRPAATAQAAQLISDLI
jgi:sugar phosphate isomerase/epimerase